VNAFDRRIRMICYK